MLSQRSLPRSFVIGSEASKGNLAGKLPYRFRAASHLRNSCLAPVTNAAQTGVPLSRVGAYQYGVSIHQGPREAMEDYLSVVEDEQLGCIFTGVFDGHGGHQAGEWLKANLGTFVINRLKQAGGNGQDITSILVDVFKETDETLISSLPRDVVRQTGATATTALIANNQIIVANVGDSEAVLCRNGVALPISVPHRLTGQSPAVATEVSRVKEAGGWIEDGRVCDILAVSRAFGDSYFKKSGLEGLLADGIKQRGWSKGHKFVSELVTVTPDVTVTDIAPEDEFLIVATDGLWDALPPADAVRWARKEFKAKSTPQGVADTLVTMALKRYTQDNVAVVVIDLKGAEHWSQRPKPVRFKLPF